jgi:hypothetical protein
MANETVAIVAGVMCLAAAIALLTIAWAPRVFAVALLVTTACLALIFLDMAANWIVSGYVGSEHGRGFRRRISRAQDPIAYWWWIAVFTALAVFLNWISARVWKVAFRVGRRTGA